MYTFGTLKKEIMNQDDQFAAAAAINAKTIKHASALLTHLAMTQLPQSRCKHLIGLGHNALFTYMGGTGGG